MKWSSAVSESLSLSNAVSQCAGDLKRDLGERVPDLIMLFVSSHHAAEEEYTRIPELVRRHFGESLLLGCSARGVIGAGREVEQRPGLAVTAALLPGVKVLPFYVDEGDLPDKDPAPETWEVLANTRASNDPAFILLPDAFSVETDDLLAGLDYALPGCAKIEGLASAGKGEISAKTHCICASTSTVPAAWASHCRATSRWTPSFPRLAGRSASPCGSRPATAGSSRRWTARSPWRSSAGCSIR